MPSQLLALGLHVHRTALQACCLAPINLPVPPLLTGCSTCSCGGTNRSSITCPSSNLPDSNCDRAPNLLRCMTMDASRFGRSMRTSTAGKRHSDIWRNVVSRGRGCSSLSPRLTVPKAQSYLCNLARELLAFNPASCHWKFAPRGHAPIHRLHAWGVVESHEALPAFRFHASCLLSRRQRMFRWVPPRPV
jgi:hypothetical protein